jgi:hypothetical protein
LFWARHRPQRVPGRWRHGPTRTRISNWRNTRTIRRGRVPYWQRGTAELKSRAPGYRDRVNPATGRPHRDDARLRRTGDAGLARMRARRGAPRARLLPRARVSGRGGR